MKQRIAHGATIETATPAEVAGAISKALDESREYDFHEHAASYGLNASGAGTDRVTTSRQYGWLLERITVTSGPNALITIFKDDENVASNLKEVIQLGTAGLYSDGFSNRIYIPAGSKVIVVTASGTANGATSYNLQVRLIKAAS